MDGKPVTAVVQLTKQAFAYVFDRTNGSPSWPLDRASRSRRRTCRRSGRRRRSRFRHKPPAFDLQGVTHDDLIDFTPALRAEAIKALESYRIGPIYTPGTVVVEAKQQGHDRGAGPRRRRKLAGRRRRSGDGICVRRLHDDTGSDRPDAEHRSRRRRGVDADYTMGGGLPTIQGLRLLKPPYGRITAYNMNKGEIAWQIPNGDTPPA